MQRQIGHQKLCFLYIFVVITDHISGSSGKARAPCRHSTPFFTFARSVLSTELLPGDGAPAVGLSIRSEDRGPCSVLPVEICAGCAGSI